MPQPPQPPPPSSNPYPTIFPDLTAAALDPGRAWHPFREGIEISRLYAVDGGGPSAAFLRYAPGARLPRHWHTGHEHILVLAGSQRDDAGTHRPGSMLLHPPGSSHAVTSDDGCVVLAIWTGPVSFEPPTRS